MARVAIGRVVRMSVAGAVGGLLSFALLEQNLRAAEIQNASGAARSVEATLAAVQSVFLLGAVVGAAIGLALIVAEEMSSRRPLRLLRLSLLGVFLGGICGMLGAFVGQIAFSVFLLLHLLVAGRAIGWAMMGAAAGLCPGAVGGSVRRAMQGVMGGLVGGGLGGLLFDAVGQMVETGAVSRFVGFILMGALIGFAVSLVEEFGKEHWLTVLTGAKEGRSYILTRPTTILGRDELADVPLFGDMSVQRQHAVLTRTLDGISLVAAPGQAVFVNNQPIVTQTLGNGDIVSVGTHRLRFGTRRAPISAYRSPLPGAEGQPHNVFQAAGVQGQTLPLENEGMPHSAMAFGAEVQTAPPISASGLEVTDGPNRGQTFRLADGAIIGRDPRCDIALTRDAQASRQHARIAWDGMQWIIEDGGSSNGTWINGQRVISADLHTGDEVSVGQSVLRVR